MKNDLEYPPNCSPMMERRLIREVEIAEDPFSRQLAIHLLEHFYNGEYEFWMQDGEIMVGTPDPEDDLNNPSDADYNEE